MKYLYNIKFNQYSTRTSTNLEIQRKWLFQISNSNFLSSENITQFQNTSDELFLISKRNAYKNQLMGTFDIESSRTDFERVEFFMRAFEHYFKYKVYKSKYHPFLYAKKQFKYKQLVQQKLRTTVDFVSRKKYNPNKKQFVQKVYKRNRRNLMKKLIVKFFKSHVYTLNYTSIPYLRCKRFLRNLFGQMSTKTLFILHYRIALQRVLNNKKKLRAFKNTTHIRKCLSFIFFFKFITLNTYLPVFNSSLFNTKQLFMNEVTLSSDYVGSSDFNSFTLDPVDPYITEHDVVGGFRTKIQPYAFVPGIYEVNELDFETHEEEEYGNPYFAYRFIIDFENFDFPQDLLLAAEMDLRVGAIWPREYMDQYHLMALQYVSEIRGSELFLVESLYSELSAYWHSSLLFTLYKKIYLEQVTSGISNTSIISIQPTTLISTNKLISLIYPYLTTFLSFTLFDPFKILYNKAYTTALNTLSYDLYLEDFTLNTLNDYVDFYYYDFDVSELEPTLKIITLAQQQFKYEVVHDTIEPRSFQDVGHKFVYAMEDVEAILLAKMLRVDVEGIIEQTNAIRYYFLCGKFLKFAYPSVYTTLVDVKYRTHTYRSLCHSFFMEKIEFDFHATRNNHLLICALNIVRDNYNSFLCVANSNILSLNTITCFNSTSLLQFIKFFSLMHVHYLEQKCYSLFQNTLYNTVSSSCFKAHPIFPEFIGDYEVQLYMNYLVYNTRFNALHKNRFSLPATLRYYNACNINNAPYLIADWYEQDDGMIEFVYDMSLLKALPSLISYPNNKRMEYTFYWEYLHLNIFFFYDLMKMAIKPDGPETWTEMNPYYPFWVFKVYYLSGDPVDWRWTRIKEYWFFKDIERIMHILQCYWTPKQMFRWMLWNPFHFSWIFIIPSFWMSLIVSFYWRKIDENLACYFNPPYEQFYPRDYIKYNLRQSQLYTNNYIFFSRELFPCYFNTLEKEDRLPFFHFEWDRLIFNNVLDTYYLPLDYWKHSNKLSIGSPLLTLKPMYYTDSAIDGFLLMLDQKKFSLIAPTNVQKIISKHRLHTMSFRSSIWYYNYYFRKSELLVRPNTVLRIDKRWSRPDLAYVKFSNWTMRHIATLHWCNGYFYGHINNMFDKTMVHAIELGQSVRKDVYALQSSNTPTRLSMLAYLGYADYYYFKDHAFMLFEYYTQRKQRWRFQRQPFMELSLWELEQQHSLQMYKLFHLSKKFVHVIPADGVYNKKKKTAWKMYSKLMKYYIRHKYYYIFTLHEFPFKLHYLLNNLTGKYIGMCIHNTVQEFALQHITKEIKHYMLQYMRKGWHYNTKIIHWRHGRDIQYVTLKPYKVSRVGRARRYALPWLREPMTTFSHQRYLDRYNGLINIDWNNYDYYYYPIFERVQLFKAGVVFGVNFPTLDKDLYLNTNLLSIERILYHIPTLNDVITYIQYGFTSCILNYFYLYMLIHYEYSFVDTFYVDIINNNYLSGAEYNADWDLLFEEIDAIDPDKSVTFNNFTYRMLELLHKFNFFNSR